ncbi:MAG: hypothetical protein IT535_01075 [Bauldia sp.]|nr:hypothetical protein [Bauldia sp.]
MRVVLFALFLLSAAGAANAQGGGKGAEICPANAFSSDETLTCRCDITEPFAGVWGSGPYTSDSSICTAAVHAGLLSSAARPDGVHHTGTVTLNRSEGCPSYAPTTANGVTTLSYGSWDSSFFFPEAGDGQCPGTIAGMDVCPAGLPSGVADLTCVCLPEATSIGVVWGTGVYTDDSAICPAAVHAGAITAAGGPVTVLRTLGQESYTASLSNGVDSRSYGSWQWSIMFGEATAAKGK